MKFAFFIFTLFKILVQILYRAQTGTIRTRHSRNFNPHSLYILSFLMAVLFIKNISLKVYLSKWETYMMY